MAHGNWNECHLCKELMFDKCIEIFGEGNPPCAKLVEEKLAVHRTVMDEIFVEMDMVCDGKWPQQYVNTFDAIKAWRKKLSQVV